MSPQFQKVHRPLWPITDQFLAKVFGRLVAVRLGRFMEHCGVLPTAQFAYRKGSGTCDALLCVSHTLQSALESGQEARIVNNCVGRPSTRMNSNISEGDIRRKTVIMISTPTIKLSTKMAHTFLKLGAITKEEVQNYTYISTEELHLCIVSDVITCLGIEGNMLK